MKKQILLYTIACLYLLFSSCNNKAPVLHKNITGKANELLIVMADDTWNGKAGELLKGSFGQFQVGLPQEEPLFDITQIPPAAFKNIFMSTRNVLQVTLSSTVVNKEVNFKENLWAYPQAIVEIRVQNLEQFEEVFAENSSKIISYFLTAERKRITANYDDVYEKTVYNKLHSDFGLTMKVPPGFVVAEQKENFIWFRYETPEISQGIVLYATPYTSDSTFTLNYLVALRDSILKENVLGEIKESYMTTEKRIGQHFQVFEHNKNYASEMRGLWALENGFMGGPYIAIDELDATNQRLVSVFGYVYAPSKNKRNFVQQVEAMIYSLKFNDQAKNDKINSQVKMGNL